MAGEYNIVPGRHEHLAAIPGIEHAAATMFSERDLPQDLRYRVTDPDTLLTAQRDGRLWVALSAGDTVVGFAYTVVISGEAYLEEMDVHPDNSRRGIGTGLLTAALDWSAGAGFEHITLITFRHLAWNAPFYEARGFEEIPQSELGDGLAVLMREEQAAGIDVQNRIAMRRVL